MVFLSPGQILRGEESGIPKNIQGWMLFIHPSFWWNISLANKTVWIFWLPTNEALFLSDKDENMINGIVDSIKNEYHSNIDKFSQDVIIVQLELIAE